MVEIEAPDGSIVEFPDGTPDAVIEQAMQETYGGGRGSIRPSPQGAVSGAVDAFTQGASFGFGDELTAAEAALLGRTPEGDWFNYDQSFGERYDRALAAERGQQQTFRDDNPVTATAAEIAGGVASAAVPVGGALKAAQSGSALARAGAGAAAAGAQGAVYGFGSGEGGLQERAENAAATGLASAAVGGIVAPVVGKAVRTIQTKAANSKFGKELLKNVPSAEDIQKAAGRLYKQADEAGVVVKPAPLQAFAKRLATEMRDEGIDADITPASSKALRRLVDAAEAGQPVRLKDLETLRKLAGRAAQKDSSERALGTAIKHRIDDFLTDLTPDDIVSGDQSGIAILKQARDMWARGARTDALEEAVRRAELRAASSGSGGNVNNAIRQEVRKLLTNKKFRGTFNPEEVRYLERVVRGSAGENAARLVGKMSPTTGALQSAGGLIAGGGAALTGNLPLAGLVAVGAGAGAGSKFIADRAAAQNAALARALIAGGGRAQVPVVDNSGRILAEQLIQRGAGAGVGPIAR
jgi:hypothetical protein